MKRLELTMVVLAVCGGPTHIDGQWQLTSATEVVDGREVNLGLVGTVEADGRTGDVELDMVWPDVTARRGAVLGGPHQV